MRRLQPQPFLMAALILIAGCGPSNDPGPVDGGADAGSDATLPDGHVWHDAWVLPDAAPPECGNGVVEPGEVCDDGNLLSGDGCNATCTLNDLWDLVGNTFTDGDQLEPSLACDASRVVAVFSDWNGLDGDGASVLGRLFGTDGVPVEAFHGADTEFTINTEAGGHQHQPRVALRPDGSTVVVWRDESELTGLGPDIRARVLGGDGAGVGVDFVVASDPTGEQATPAVAVADDGGYLVVWVDDNPAGPDTSGFGIRGRLFAPSGAPALNAQTGDDGSFQINQIHAGTQFQVDVAWLGNRYLVVWADGSGQLDPSSYGVVGTLLDTTGTFVGTGTDFAVNTTTTGLQAAPRVAAQAGFGAVVVWTDDSQTDDPHNYGVRARLLDTEGVGRTNGLSLTDADFQANTTLTAGQQLPVVAAQADGSFGVAWQDWSAADGSGASIRARLFSLTATPVVSDLSPSGDDFQVNTTFWNGQLTPTLCAVGAGFVAMWEDESEQSPDSSGVAIRYRLLPGAP